MPHCGINTIDLNQQCLSRVQLNENIMNMRAAVAGERLLIFIGFVAMRIQKAVETLRSMGDKHKSREKKRVKDVPFDFYHASFSIDVRDKDLATLLSFWFPFLKKYPGFDIIPFYFESE